MLIKVLTFYSGIRMTHALWKSPSQNFMVRVVVYSLCQHWSMLVIMAATPGCLIKPQIYILVCNNGNMKCLHAQYGIWIRGDPVVEHSFFMTPFCRLPKTYINQRIILWSFLIFFMIQDHNSFSILTLFINETTVKLYLPLPEKVVIMKLIIISVNRVCFLLCTQRGYATSFYRPQNFRALCLIWIANLPYDGKLLQSKRNQFLHA